MADWVSATQDHIPHLQAFVCTAGKPAWSSAFRRKVDKEPWATRAQSIVRNLRPGDLNPPDSVELLFDDDGSGDIAAVACVMFGWQPSGALHAVVPVMAVRLDRQGAGLGSVVLRRIADLVATEAMTRPRVEYVKIEAEVHPENHACKRMIGANGWGHTGPADDGFLEVWAAIIAIEKQSVDAVAGQ